MNLDNFEEKIDDVILDRGWNYYQDDCIKSIAYDQESKVHTAVVAGTYDYNVTVQLDGNEILAAGCDCPYDMGPFCKHQVAVFYLLRKSQKQNKNVAASGTPVNSPAGGGPDHSRLHPAEESASDWYAAIISAQPKERLVEFLVSLCLQHDEIGSRVGFEFDADSAEDQRSRSIDLIRSCIRQHSDRHGFVGYAEAYGASQGAWMVIQRAKDAASSGDYAAAATFYLCVLHEMVPLLESADDSGGYIGGTIEEAVAGLGALAETRLPEDFAKELFSILLKESTNRIYDDWPDWAVSLLEKCSTLASTASQKKRLEERLDSSCENSWSSRYMVEQLAQIRYRLILKFDGEKSAVDFIEQRIDLPHFREMAINNALSIGDYERTIKLALDGEHHDRDWGGLVKKWKEIRYEAYGLSSQMENQRRLAMEFILDGHFAYYQKLKSTYTEQAWLSVYPGIIQTLEAKKSYSQVYPSILIEEHELQKLLEYVKASPDRIVAYHRHLLSDFRDEVYEIWIQHILVSAQRASNRRDYQDICSLVRSLIKDGGAVQARRVVSQLLSTYSRKPAFRAELRKITE